MSPDAFRSCAGPFRMELRVAAITVENPGLALITQADVEDFPKPFSRAARGNGRHYFNAFRKISKHPVGGSDVKLALDRIFLAGREIKDAGVLKEATDNRPYANPFATSRYTRPQTTEAADHNVDGHAGGGCVAQGFNQIGRLELIHLDDDA